MSKRPDESDVPELEEGTTTAERRRRRRRGAGLRVPSDNVPRRTQPQPVVAPVPEDPNLAISVAYSFSGEGGEAQAGGVPKTSAALAAAAATAEQLGDVVADGRTKEMPAVQLEELGLEVPEDLARDGEAAQEPSGDTMVVDVDEMKVEEDEPKPAPVRNRASTVALSDDDLEELVEPLQRGGSSAPGSNGQHEGAVAKPSAEALEAFDDHSSPELPTVSTRATSAGWDDGDIERHATDPSATGEQDIDLDDEDLKDEVVQPADASDSGEILSDELIEEVEAQSAQPVPLREPESSVAAAPAPAPQRAATVPPEPTPAPVAAKEPEPPAPAPAPPKPEPKPDAPAAQAKPTPPAAPHKPPPAPPPSAKKPTAARVAAVAAAVAPTAAETREEKRRRSKPWFEEIFDEDYLRTLPFLTPQATQSEAQFVIEALGLQPGSQVLDLGCGYGRHAMELAARGFHVVGLDLSLPLLLRGADEAQRRGLTINFVHGDMRELDFDSQFDGAYCVFSTFGYFDDETNKKTATNLARALKPGAKVVIDILNRDYLIADLPTRVWWEGDGCVVLEEVEFNYFSSRVQTNRSVVFDDGRQVEQEISMRAYSLHEIGKLLHAAGFRVLEISGSMVTRGRFFGGTSRQIIVVAERRPKESGA